MTNEYELTDLGATEYGALVRDARRYRWLRDINNLSAGDIVSAYAEKPLDAAIDAAMEAAK